MLSITLCILPSNLPMRRRKRDANYADDFTEFEHGQGYVLEEKKTDFRPTKYDENKRMGWDIAKMVGFLFWLGAPCGWEILQLPRFLDLQATG